MAVKAQSNSLNAPAQHTQASRKGKRAWRKNVDIDDVEQGLELVRQEERVIGTSLQKQSDTELFRIDTTGDEDVRAKLKRFDKTQLKSAKVLAARSAVPAVLSRRSKATVSRKDKDRLLRMSKRKRVDALDAHLANPGLGAGSATFEPSEAVNQSGKYDVWTTPDVDRNLAGLGGEALDFIGPIVKKPKVNAPKITDLREKIDLAPLSVPHAGTSYNPIESAHRELLTKAIIVEEQREAKSKKYDDVKAAIDASRGEGSLDATGMLIDVPTGDVNSEDQDDESLIIIAAKPPRRKTQQQRRRAVQLRVEKHALEQKAADKRLRMQLERIKSIRKSVRAAQSAQTSAVAERERIREEKLRAGLAGQRMGKHKVDTGQIDVQLGEELSESLRALKPEGNLFRERFISMQQRALIEPRVRVLPKRRKLRIKDFELHGWKNFDRT